MRRTATRATVLLLSGALAMLGFSGAASAHAGGLSTEPNRPVVLSVQPAVAGLSVRTVEFGARLRLDNGTGQTVSVLPPAGSMVNTMPTVAPGGHVYWSDPRIAAAGARDRPPSGRLAWRIPMLAGGSPVAVLGEQRWPPPPPAGLWWLATALMVAVPSALVALGTRRGVVRPWSRRLLAATTSVVVLAHLVHIWGSALVPEQRSLVAVFLAAAGFAVLGWPLGVLGAALTVRDRPSGPLLCAVTAALLAVIIAPADVLSFHDAVVPYAWGALLDRVLITLTVGGGLGVLVSATVLMRRAGTAGTTARSGPGS